MKRLEQMIIKTFARADVLPAKTFWRMLSRACPRGAEIKNPVIQQRSRQISSQMSPEAAPPHKFGPVRARTISREFQGLVVLLEQVDREDAATLLCGETRRRGAGEVTCDDLGDEAVARDITGGARAGGVSGV
jgi:hypothetical protein